MNTGLAANLLTVLISMLLSLPLAMLSHRIIERPVKGIARRLGMRP